MIKELHYPQKGYIKNIKQAVNNGISIKIIITKPNVASLINETLKELESESKSKSSFFGFFSRWFRLSAFLTGHFYAIAANYQTKTEINGNLVVNYVKNT